MIRPFLRPAILVSEEEVADIGNIFSALLHNANMYAAAMASYATTTAPSVSAADLARGVVQLNTGAGAGYDVTLPTTAQILGALGATVTQDGSFTKIVRFVNNNSGQTATIVAGDTPTSIIGTATLANDTARDFAMRVLASAITLTNIGSLTL